METIEHPNGPPKLEKLVALFEQEVGSKSSEIDPDNSYDWYDLALGWALGKGLSIGEAVNVALEINYKH